MNNNSTDGLFFSLNGTKKIPGKIILARIFLHRGAYIITLKMYRSLLALTTTYVF